MESTTPDGSPTKPAILPRFPETITLSSDPVTSPLPLPPTVPVASSGKPQATPQEIDAKLQVARERKAQREAAARSERIAAGRKYGRANLDAHGFTRDKGGGASHYRNGSGGQYRAPTLIHNETTGAFDEVPPPPYVVDPRCTEEQRQVLEQVRAGKNVFFTGSAGVGKSFLLKEIRSLLDDEQRAYWVTASSGIAALQVEGTTTHSWAGVGLAADSLEKLYWMCQKRKGEGNKWISTRVLIIDEISMISSDFFTKLNCLGKLIRRNNLPFGGIQIILSGDFFQLPPVPNNHLRCPRCGHNSWKRGLPASLSSLPPTSYPAGLDEPKVRRCIADPMKSKTSPGCGLELKEDRFCFESETWAECHFQVMELTHVFRQKDREFIGNLNQIRRGICTDEMVKLFETYGSDLLKDGGIKPTNLYPHVASVDKENETEYRKLDGLEYSYRAMDNFIGDNIPVEKAKARLRDLPAEQDLKLKVGSQVLLLANVNVGAGLVNGSRGVVTGFELADSPGLTPTAQAANEEWKAEAQRNFLDSSKIDTVENGVKSKATWLPEVYFASDTTSVVQPHTWAIDLDSKHTVGRTQIPLKLGWALTIHKSQGQSLDAVSVKLQKSFEDGQAYVALSRARTPAGMKVEGLTPSSVRAHPTVAAFYHQIAKGLPFFVDHVAPVNPLSFIPEKEWHHYDANMYGVPPPLVKRSSLFASATDNDNSVDSEMMELDYKSDLYSQSAGVASSSNARVPQSPVRASQSPARREEEPKDWKALLNSAVTEFRNSEEFTGSEQYDTQRFLAVARQLVTVAAVPPLSPVKPISASNPFYRSPSRPVVSTSPFRAARTPSPSKLSPSKRQPIPIREDRAEEHTELSDEEFEDKWNVATLGGMDFGGGPSDEGRKRSK